VHLIPFNLRFVDRPQKENERQRDPYLLNKLKEEREGILAWLVRGCLAWQELGRLDPPPQVQLATEDYRSDEDTIGQFIDEYCVRDPDSIVLHLRFYREYAKWCKDLHLWASGSRDFGRRMKEQFQSKRTKQGITYVGIGLPLRGNPGQMGFDG